MRRYVYIQLIHFVVQQKLTQRCKAVILQLRYEKKSIIKGSNKRIEGKKGIKHIEKQTAKYQKAFLTSNFLKCWIKR